MDTARCDSWIGLKRTNRHSSWTWTDGTAYGVDVLKDGKKELWNHWARRDDVCGRWGWGMSKTWDDVSCYESKPFTCAVRKLATESAAQRALRRKKAYGPQLMNTAPRCGVPAGYTVDSVRAQDGETLSNFDKDGEVLAATGCTYRAMHCPSNTVAVGFKFDTSRGHPGNGRMCSHDILSLKLLCAPYTMEDSPNFKRMCSNANCQSLAKSEIKLVTTPSECTDLCEKTAGCLSVRITDTNASSSASVPTVRAMGHRKKFKGAILLPDFDQPRQCELFRGLCTENAEKPFGRAVKNYSYTKPAVFNPVELEHPTTAGELLRFNVSKVTENVLINAKAVT